MNFKLWGILLLLIVVFGGLSVWLSNMQTGPERIDLVHPTSEQMKKTVQAQSSKTPSLAHLKNATLEPGRVVVLDTNRGVIEFVLYEKDCPKTTARIAELIQGGFYNGVKFPRVVENFVIQTDQAKKKVPPMGCEIAKGLTHEKGSVGMARTDDPNSNTSAFYITRDPAPHLDMLYTTFGRVISGMDVVMKIQVGDVIKTATLRPFTTADKKRLNDVITIEAERKTQ